MAQDVRQDGYSSRLKDIVAAWAPDAFGQRVRLRRCVLPLASALEANNEEPTAGRVTAGRITPIYGSTKIGRDAALNKCTHQLNAQRPSIGLVTSIARVSAEPDSTT